MLRHYTLVICHMVVMESCFVSLSAVVDVQAKKRRNTTSIISNLALPLVIEPALLVIMQANHCYT